MIGFKTLKVTLYLDKAKTVKPWSVWSLSGWIEEQEFSFRLLSSSVFSKAMEWDFRIDQALGFPGGAVVKNLPASAGDARDLSLKDLDLPWIGKIPWSRKWQPTPVFLPGKIPWTEVPGGLQSVGLQRVRHNWARTYCSSSSDVRKQQWREQKGLSKWAQLLSDRTRPEAKRQYHEVQRPLDHRREAVILVVDPSLPVICTWQDSSVFRSSLCHYYDYNFCLAQGQTMALVRMKHYRWLFIEFLLS